MTEITVEQFAEAVARGRVQYKDWQGNPAFISSVSGWSPDEWTSLIFDSELWEPYTAVDGVIQIDGVAYSIEEVASHGGEGEGSNAYVVFRVGEDQYFKKTGDYQSHYGYCWDGPIVKVYPATKTITVYE